jgi:chromate transporter
VLTLVAVLGTSNLFSQQAILFSQSAVVTFGGAYAVLGYIAQQAVDHYRWISPSDMITGLGLAETTPGPLIMVVEFVAFVAAYRNPGALTPLLAGTLAATLTVWVTFLPCFAFIFGGAPYVERLRDNASLTHALTAIGAAVAGVVLNLAVWFALHTTFAGVDDVRYGPLQLSIPDWPSVRTASVTISVVALLLVFRARQSTLRVLLACAALGMAASLAGLT